MNDAVAPKVEFLKQARSYKTTLFVEMALFIVLIGLFGWITFKVAMSIVRVVNEYHTEQRAATQTDTLDPTAEDTYVEEEEVPEDRILNHANIQRNIRQISKDVMDNKVGPVYKLRQEVDPKAKWDARMGNNVLSHAYDDYTYTPARTEDDNAFWSYLFQPTSIELKAMNTVRRQIQQLSEFTQNQNKEILRLIEPVVKSSVQEQVMSLKDEDTLLRKNVASLNADVFSTQQGLQNTNTNVAAVGREAHSKFANNTTHITGVQNDLGVYRTSNDARLNNFMSNDYTPFKSATQATKLDVSTYNADAQAAAAKMKQLLADHEAIMAQQKKALASVADVDTLVRQKVDSSRYNAEVPPLQTTVTQLQGNYNALSNDQTRLATKYSTEIPPMQTNVAQLMAR